MTDPLDALRTPVTPVDPDPGFAEALRARLRRVLLDRRGEPTMTTNSTSTAPSAPPAARPQGRLGYVSLWVPDAEATAALMAAALGWTYAGGRGHRMVAGAEPHHGIVDLAALPAGVWDDWPRHATLSTTHAVDDVDAAVERVRSAGGRAEQPTEQPWGRTAGCADDQGMPFAIYEDGGAVPQHPAAREPGRLAYVTIEAVDSALARAFYGAVFGWRFLAGPVPDAWEAEGVRPMIRLHGGHERATVVPMYAVDDVHAAAALVRAHGGTATAPERRRHGTLSFCADAAGTRFGLGRFG